PDGDAGDRPRARLLGRFGNRDRLLRDDHRVLDLLVAGRVLDAPDRLLDRRQDLVAVDAGVVKRDELEGRGDGARGAGAVDDLVPEVPEDARAAAGVVDLEQARLLEAEVEGPDVHAVQGRGLRLHLALVEADLAQG